MLKCSALLLLLGSFCSVSSATVLSIAHRGDSLFAPENTLTAFQSALPKADFVELDVHISSDGQLMVMHDSTVDRTTEGTGTLASKSALQLKQLDAGSWFAPQFTGERIPTLAEALNVILPSSVPLIEHKAGAPAAYAAELRRLNLVTNVVVQSFNWSFLAGLRALEPQVKLAALGSGTLTPTIIANALSTGAQTLAWEKSSISPSDIGLVHAAGLKLFVWTVDGAEIDRFIEMGVDGIISNDPGRVRSAGNVQVPSTTYLGSELVAYWPCDEGLMMPGSRTLAEAWGTNHAIIAAKAGSRLWLTNAEAKFGSSIQVEGNDVYAEVPASAPLDINTNAVTLSLWVKLRNLPSNIDQAFAGIFDSVQDSYALYLDKSGQELKFKVTTSSGQAARPGIRQSLLMTNEWLHVVGTYTGQAGPVSGQATIYLNGVAADVHTAGDSGGGAGLTGIVKPGQVAALGRNGTQSTYPFYGVLDDIAVWSRALSASEVRLLFQHGSRGASIKDLLRKPTHDIVILSSKWTEAGFRISFQSTGTWQAFSLLHSPEPTGPFIETRDALEGTAPGGVRFLTNPHANQKAGYFRVAPRW